MGMEWHPHLARLKVVLVVGQLAAARVAFLAGQLAEDACVRASPPVLGRPHRYLRKTAEMQPLRIHADASNHVVTQHRELEVREAEQRQNEDWRW